jgi:hypothetical protein
MPVRKFRTVDEMNAPVWREPGDPALAKAMAGLWDVARRTHRRRYPPGVHKHRSIEELQSVQAEWVAGQPDD